MGQAATLQIAVDQRGDDPDLGQAEPGGDEIGRIFHEQGDRVSRPIALRQRPMGDPVGARFKGGIADRIPFKIKGDIVRIGGDRGFDIIGDQQMGIRINILDLCHHAFERSRKTDLTLDDAEYSHGFSLSGFSKIVTAKPIEFNAP